MPTFTPAVIKKMMGISPDRPHSLKEVTDRYNAVLEAISDPREKEAFKEGFEAYARGDDIYNDVGSHGLFATQVADLALKQSSITGVPEGQKAKDVIFSASYLTRLKADNAKDSGNLKSGGTLGIIFKNNADPRMCTTLTVDIKERRDGVLETGQERVEPSSLVKFGMHDATAYDRPIVKRVEVGPCPP